MDFLSACINRHCSLKRLLAVAVGVSAVIGCGSSPAGPSASPPAAQYQVLHSFTGGNADGAGPAGAGLVQAADGTFYGTTYQGGAFGLGTIFKVSGDGSSHSLIHSFDFRDGVNPYAGLVRGSDGALYGTTLQGGPSRIGTIFRVLTDGSSFSVLHAFARGSSDGANPSAPLMQGSDGAFYGTTFGGGAFDAGTVFRVTVGGSFTLLHSLDANSGYNPRAPLVQGADGALYGTTYQGGASGVGTIFKVSADGSSFFVLRNFDTVTGAYPYAGLVQGMDGAFCGTTAGGGTSGVGTIFRVSADGSSLSRLHSFDSVDATNGAYPEAGLVRGRDGAFYGTTIQGGVVNCHDRGCGTVFRINPDGSSFSVLHKFMGGSTDGGAPNASLVQGTDGAFYGTTTQGGSLDQGVVFRLRP